MDGKAIRNCLVVGWNTIWKPKLGWREIPKMFLGRYGLTKAPLLVAVVNSQVFAAVYVEEELRKYDKMRNLWIIVGWLPEQAVLMNGWGLAFLACGDWFVVIGDARAVAAGILELNSWLQMRVLHSRTCWHGTTQGVLHFCRKLQ